MAIITSLHIYPVKALQAIDLKTAHTNEYGFAYDRTWMLVDSDGVCITQRDIPELATFQPFLNNDIVTVSHGDDQITLNPDKVEGKGISCKLWQTEFLAREYSKEVSRWFSNILGRTVRLVQPGIETYRTAKDQPDTPVNFQDAQQILVISEASLAELNSRLEVPVTMDRFRPNIVVDGLEAFEEDQIDRMTIGDTVMIPVGSCGRCKVTTIDQKTGQQGKEPLRTLATYRLKDGKVLFGQYFRIESEDDTPLKVGDTFKK